MFENPLKGGQTYIGEPQSYSWLTAERNQIKPTHLNYTQMKIYTYHAHVPGLNIEAEHKLMLLWQAHHRKLGYNPIVLNEYIARKHRDYDLICAKIKSLGSVNTEAYEKACYLRWMAMDQVGGSVMMDYDCFIYDPKHFVPLFKNKRVTTCYQEYVPCLVHATFGWGDMVKAILAYQPAEQDQQEFGRVHVSDMHLLLNKAIQYQARTDVKMYMEAGWEQAPAVHYSSASMHTNGKGPKFQWIPKLRP